MGEDTYKTMFGGAVSLLVWSIFCVFFYIKSVIFFAQTESDLGVQEMHVDLTDIGDIELMNHNFIFAINKLEPNLARVEVNQVIMDTNTREEVRTPIPMMDCQALFKKRELAGNPVNSDFRLNRQFKSGDPFLCPDAESMIVRGEYYADEFKYIEVLMKGCELGEGACLSKESINSIKVNLFSPHSNIDFEEFDLTKMIKYSTTAKMFSFLDSIFAAKHIIYLMENKIELEDSRIKIFDMSEELNVVQQHGDFMYYERVLDYEGQPLRDQTLTAFYLQSDSMHRIYSRSTYGVTDYLGDLGGLFDILMLFGVSLTSFITHKLWVGSMIRQFFQIQKYFMDETDLE